MRLTIQYKFTIIISILVAVLFISIYLHLKNNLEQFTYQRIRGNLHKELYLVKTFLEKMYEEAMASSEADDIADLIGENLGLRATIIAADGTVLGDSELEGEALAKIENHLYRPEVEESMENGLGTSRRFSTTTKEEMLYMALPFRKSDAKGFIRLAIPLSEIKLVTQHLKGLLIVSFLVAFSFAVLIGFGASILLSRPIKEIVYLTGSIAKGDFSKKVNVRTKDELKDLAEAINFMSDQIKSRIEEVSTGKSHLEAVFLSMVEGVLIVDERGTILLMNKALKDFLYVQREPIGKRPIEIIRNVEIQDLTDAVLKLKNGVESRELTVLLPEEKTLLIHAAPIVRQQEIEGAVLVFHDITDLRRLEKVRQDFVANVSHELRTPIASIKGYAETLIEGAIDDKDNAMDFLKIICTDADRLAKLINDLLDLSRIESGKLNPDLKMTPLGPLVSHVVGTLTPQAKDLRVTIEDRLPQDLPSINIDPSLISQVFFNLVENAIKYNRPEGRVLITAEEKDDAIQVSIKDTGIGIPETDLPRVFERFYRVDKARSCDLGGTGLGLSIVKHILQVHRGDVSVQSILGEGSTFTVVFPKA